MAGIGLSVRHIAVAWMLFYEVASRPDSSETSGSSSSSGSRNRPNIVLVLTELNTNDVGFNNPDVISPNIDELANTGVVLDRFYTTSDSRSRHALFSGKHLTTLALHGNIVRPDTPYGLPLDSATLGDRLKDQGYATHYVGKWHLGNFKREYTPTYRGFDTFYGFYSGLIDEYNHSLPCPSNASDWGYDMWENKGEDLKAVRPQNMVGTFKAHLLRERAVRNIDRHDQGEPLFMVVSPNEPRLLVRNTPQAYTDLYNDKADTIELGLRQRFAKVTVLDDMIGDIVNALKFNRMWENTLFILISDKGGSSTLHNGSLSEYLVNDPPSSVWSNSYIQNDIEDRTVAVFHSPSLLANRQGAHVSDYVDMADLFPTLLHVAGIPHAQDETDAYGLNMWPTIRDGVQGPRSSMLLFFFVDASVSPFGGTPLYTDTFDTRWYSGYVDGNFKLITGFKTYLPKTYYLYNIATDPLHQHDLSDDPAYTGRLRAMLDVVQTWALRTPPAAHYLPENEQDPAACPRHHGGVYSPWK